MGFGKAAIIFLMIAMFAFTVVAVSSTMLNDKPTDTYYDDGNNSASGSTGMVEGMMGTGSSLLIPILGISGILVLFAGFMVLRK